MTELQVPSNNFNSIGFIGEMDNWWEWTKLVSTKQWVDLESTRVENSEKKSEMEGEVRETWREFSSERVDALRRTASRIAQEEPTQSSVYAEAWGLLRFFWNLEILCPSPWPWRQTRRTSGNPWQCIQFCHRTCRGYCQSGVDAPAEWAFHLSQVCH